MGLFLLPLDAGPRRKGSKETIDPFSSVWREGGRLPKIEPSPRVSLPFRLVSLAILNDPLSSLDIGATVRTRPNLRECTARSDARCI